MQAVADTFVIGDVSVRRLGFGAMRLTGPGTWGEPGDRSEAKRVLRRAIKLGVNLIDTADAYGPRVSERLIAQALHPYPENLVIATKGGSDPPASSTLSTPIASQASTRSAGSSVVGLGHLRCRSRRGFCYCDSRGDEARKVLTDQHLAADDVRFVV